MSMLAGPRHKQKVINLRAKNNAWSNDNSKFGQRMLEKMGWSSGKGLGAKENGIVDHVVARYKNDEKGLGFEDKNDQWTKHEDDFNALLANLSNADSNEEVLHSGVSLEVKSKKSKARIHYHKFTRGKDLSRYSKKDLANIFGKKSLKNEKKPEEVLEVDVKVTEQVFTEKGSMVDYFKNKLATLKLLNKISTTDSEQNSRDDEYGFKGFSGTANNDEEHQNFGFQAFSFYSTPVSNVTDKENEKSVTEDITEEKIKKNKKKKKKAKQEDAELFDKEMIKITEIETKITKCNADGADTNGAEFDMEVAQVKKSKKSKRRHVSALECVNDMPEDYEPKKKQSRTKIIPEETEDNHELVTEDIHVPKKKKKRKNKLQI